MKRDKIIKDKIWLRKPILLYLLVILLSLSVFYIHFEIVDMQKSDSILINLAGRQRMLTQMLAKDLLLFKKSGKPAVDRKKIRKNIKVFDVTLQALLHGGQAPLDLGLNKYVQLPKAETALIAEQLKKVVRLWEQSKRRFLFFIDRNDFQYSPSAVRYGNELLVKMDKAVLMMRAAAKKNKRDINLILYITNVLVIMVVLVLFVLNIYRMKHTKNYIKHLEAILPICANCKKIREPNADPKNQVSWTAIECYIEERSESMFSHSICPSCEEELYGQDGWYLARKQEKEKGATSNS